MRTKKYNTINTIHRRDEQKVDHNQEEKKYSTQNSIQKHSFYDEKDP
jgi:hypothetical protein